MAIPIQNLDLSNLPNAFAEPMRIANELPKNIFLNEILGSQARYAPQMSREQLNKAQLDNINQALINKYLPGKSEAEIYATRQQGGLYGAEAGRTRAQTSLLGPQIAQANLENQLMQSAFGVGQQLGGVSQARVQQDYGQQMPIGQGLQPQQSPLINQITQQQIPGQGQQSPLIAQSTGAQSPLQFQQFRPTSPQFGDQNQDAMSKWLTFKRLKEGRLSPEQEVQKRNVEEINKQDISAWNKAQDVVSQSSEDAITTKNLIDQFNDAYGKSTYKGQILGNVPSRPRGLIESATMLPLTTTHDFTSEQIADNAAQNLQMMMLKLMKTNRLTNYELNFVGGLKLGRQMTPETVKQVGGFLKAKADRMTEQQDFYNSARNSGVSKREADNLWNMYNNQRPVFDFSKQKQNDRFQGSWRDYLNQRAVDSIRTGEHYIPDNVKKEDLKYLTADQLQQLANSGG